MIGLQSSFAWIAGQPGAVRGTLWMVLAAALFTGMPVAVRTLSDHMGPAEIIFFRSALGLAFMAPYFLWSGVRPLRTNVHKLHIQRSAINLARRWCCTLRCRCSSCSWLRCFSESASGPGDGRRRRRASWAC
jgi:hypothetical protein